MKKNKKKKNIDIRKEDSMNEKKTTDRVVIGTIHEININDGSREEKALNNLSEKFQKMGLGGELARGSYGIVSKSSINGKECVRKHVKGSIFQLTTERKSYVEKELLISNLVCGVKFKHLTNVIKVDTEKNFVFMEYSGVPLQDFISKVSITTHILSSLITHLVLAAKELLSLGLIHRDISVRNVVVSWNPVRFKLCDFGSCSQNPQGTININRKTDNPDEIYTWKTDIFFIGLLARNVMTKTLHPFVDPKLKKSLLSKEFGNYCHLVDNMTDKSPENRPDHDDIIKGISLIDVDESLNFSNFTQE
jgi:serine/threonine protein kinase